MFCSNCGKRVNDDAKFCWNCGSAITPHEQTPSPEPEQPAPVTPPAPVGEEKQTETKEEAYTPSPALVAVDKAMKKAVKSAKPVLKQAGTTLKETGASLKEKATAKKNTPKQSDTPSSPKKLNKKQLLKVGGGLLAAMLLVILIVALSNYISDNKKVGEIPDPMYYFVDFTVDEVDSSDSLRIIYIRGEGAFNAAQGYMNLLDSTAYPFVLMKKETTSTGNTVYDFCYNGEETYKDPWAQQISVVIAPKANEIRLLYSDCSHFNFVSREQYSGEMYLPSMESYLGVNWEMKETDGRLYYDFGDMSDDAAKLLIDEYADMLCSQYGFTLMDKDTLNSDYWILSTENQNAIVRIACYGGGIQLACFVDDEYVAVSDMIVFVSVAPATSSANSEGTEGNTEEKESDAGVKAVEASTPSPVPSVKVAESVDLSYLFEKKENGVQDIRYWSNGSIQFDDDPLDMGSYIIYYLDCSKTELAPYIDMLCQNGFTLVAEYDRTSMGISGDKFIAYALVSDHVSGLSTRSGQYTKAQNHIDIWWESMHSCWRMEVVKGLELCDLGIRKGGSVVDISTLGESAESGLLYQDGYYTTEDGRLRSGEKEATIVVDGEVMTGELYNLEKKSRNEYRFYMDGFGKGEMEFSWDKRSMEEGSVFLNTLEEEDISFTLLLPNGSTKLSSESYKGFSKLLLRVMHYDAEGDAVFYLYGESFSGHSVEALMAVNLWEMDNPTTPEPIDASGAETISVSEDTTIRIKVGQTVVLHCAYSEFGSKYHTYDWSSSGSAVNISGTYNKATVKGIEPGTATISMTYHYTKDEPDVLTGNTRHNGHSRSRTYTIIVE